MKSFSFPAEVLVHEPTPNGLSAETFSYTPFQLLTQILSHLKAILDIPLASWTSTAYEINADWRFFMDNYMIIINSYKALKDKYTDQIWATLTQMIIIVAFLALSLVLALITQVYFIFEPLLATATMASGTLLSMASIHQDRESDQ
jgi:hypothetical protein